MTDTAAQPPAASQPCADQGSGILGRYLLERPAEGTVGGLEQAAECLDLGELDEQVRVIRLDLHCLGQEAGCLGHRGPGASVLRGQYQVTDGLLLLPGQDEVPRDLCCARTAARTSAMLRAGAWLLASRAQQQGELVVQAGPDRGRDVLVGRVAQQCVPESCLPVAGY